MEYNHLSLEDFKGSKIEKSFNAAVQNNKVAEFSKAVRNVLTINLESRAINQDTFNKAITQLDSFIEKAGEGSKGGKIIGHTKSGKPVYARGSKVTKDLHKNHYNSDDHRDAAEIHSNEASKHKDEAYRRRDSYGRDLHSQLAEYHKNYAEHHFKLSEEKSKAEHSDTEHPDDKAIVAEMNKSKADHHDKLQKFHEDMAKHTSENGPRHSRDAEEYTKQEIRRHIEHANYHASEKEKYSK